MTNGQAEVRDRLIQAGWSIVQEKSLAYGIQFQVSDGKDTIPVNVYHGKRGQSIVVGGSASSPLALAVKHLLLAEELPFSAAASQQGEADRGAAQPVGVWIGTDESGKGDYFGPLVTAGMVVDAKAAEFLLKLGIRDSKKLTDDKIAQMAQTIRQTFPDSYCELELVPERYNALYRQLVAEGRNLNHLLAWTHVRIIENLLETHPRCQRAVVDQFAKPGVIEQRLMTKGRQIQVIQMHRAESDIAVAAASVLARDRFVSRMCHLAQQYGLQLPKGASAAVVAAAKAFVRQYGKERLGEVAKLHFRTTDQL